MPTASISKPLSLFLLASGACALLFIHFFHLGSTPGLHFDEAWAMNYAWRIAGGELTLTAMSPYTAPYAHYWAALWMKWLGPSLSVFRLSQVILSLGGLGLLGAALWRAGYRRAAALLPWAVVLLPGLSFNHRFAIELNGFHVFCLGALALAAVARRPALVALFWAMGTTAHILFYGVGLALIGALVWSGHSFSRREKISLAAACTALALFFVRVALLIPEKGKAIALALSALLLLGLVLLRAESWAFWRKPFWDWLAGVGALAFLFNALFFLDGGWGLAISSGSLFPYFAVAFLPLVGWAAWRGAEDFPPWLRRAFLLSVICLGAMMLKPAPRYFEIVFLGLLVFFAQGLGVLRGRAALSAALALNALVLFFLYFHLVPVEKDLKFLFFKDSSRDFLSKQRLVSVLAGCKLSGIQTSDSRVLEALRALSLGDWPKGEICPWRHPRIERQAEAAALGGTTANATAVADFLIWESP